MLIERKTTTTTDSHCYSDKRYSHKASVTKIPRTLLKEKGKNTPPLLYPNSVR